MRRSLWGTCGVAALVVLHVASAANAAVTVFALPVGPQTIVIEGLSGYGGGPVGVHASIPVTIFFDAYRTPDIAISGSSSGWLDLSFTIAASAVRDYYPTLLPGQAYANGREGGAFSGQLADVHASLTVYSPALGRDATLLDIVSTAPTANFGVFDFRSFHSGGGMKVEHTYKGAEQHAGFIQAGNCHVSLCVNPSPADFINTSELLAFEQTIQPGSFRGWGIDLGDSSDAFTTSATEPFTVAFRGLYFQSAIPEPASWSLMLAGFGVVGGSLRQRRSIAAQFGASPGVARLG